MLGPVLERLHNELLDPLIDRTFNILQENGVLPPPPEELSGRDLSVEYVSVLAQAQQMVGIGAIERTATFAGQLAAIWPEARHKLDATQAVDDYAIALGINPKTIRSDDEVKKIVAAEQQAAQMQQMGNSMQQAADIASTASDVKLDEDNAVATMMRNAGLL